MAESPAETQAKQTALEELRARLGHGGLLQQMTLYSETGDAAARDAMLADLDGASKALRGYRGQRLTPAETALVTDLERMLATYSRVLEKAKTPQALTGPATLTLVTQHAAVADRIARLRHDQAVAERTRLEQIATRGFWLGTAAVLALAATIGAMLWLLLARVLAPMRTLSTSVAGTARGDWRAPVWGTERRDEFGDLARAVDGFRRQAAEIPDLSVLGDDGRVRVKFEGKSSDLFTALSNRLRDAGDALVLRGAEVGKVVAEVHRDITGTVGEVKDLCTGFAKSSSEGTERLSKAADILAHAAAQVEAFDPRNPSGGLDALVATLRQNAEQLGETYGQAAGDVSRTLQSIAVSEAQLRDVTATAGDAAKEMGATLAEVEVKLAAATKLLSSSGEKLLNVTDKAEGRLGAAVDAVDAGEKALVAALGQASAKLADVTGTAADRLDDAASQVARSAELLESQATASGSSLHDAVDELHEACTALRLTTNTQVDRLEPITGQVERLHKGLSTIIADVGMRAADIAQVLTEFQSLSADLRDEMERMRLEPDARSAAEDMYTRLSDTLDRLTNQVEVVEESAKRLSTSLTDGVDEATERLLAATQEMSAEGRGIVDRATGAAEALDRTAERQDALLAGLEGQTALAQDLRGGLAEASSLAEALAAATEAVQALARTADRAGEEELADLRRLLGDLTAKMDGLDAVSGQLGGAAETVRALLDAADRERVGAETAEREALAAIADDLKGRLADIDRLEAGLTATTEVVRAQGGVEDEQRQRLAALAETLEGRMDTIEGLSRQLTRAIDAIYMAAERGNATTNATANANRELSQKLAAVAEQLRATATGLNPPA